MLLHAMNVPGLTRENVASHLQKYRESLRKNKPSTSCETNSNISGHPHASSTNTDQITHSPSTSAPSLTHNFPPPSQDVSESRFQALSSPKTEPPGVSQNRAEPILPRDAQSEPSNFHSGQNYAPTSCSKEGTAIQEEAPFIHVHTRVD